MIGIVSVGLSNLSSIRNALEFLGYKSILLEEPRNFQHADKILLPGVGSFKEAMTRLKEKELDSSLKDAYNQGVPVLGICLGMQLLADIGFEGGESEGLGLIPGSVSLIDCPKLKLPHMGWNNISIRNSDKVVTDSFNELDYYFIHSYQFHVAEKNNVLATSNYGQELPSIVKKDHVYGFQFHPEKSQRAGLELLKSFIINA